MFTVRVPLDFLLLVLYSGDMDYPDFHSKGTPNCQNAEDLEMFFPDPYGKGAGIISRNAKKVCHGCAYVVECLAWALYNSEPGVWGETTENERRKMKRDAIRRGKPILTRITNNGS